jgi:TonB family protein
MKNAATISGAGALDQAKSYPLTSDLAQYCLPSAARDESRKFAWTNSICCFVLVVGLLGLEEPRLPTRELPDFLEVIPVVFTPPEATPPPAASEQTEEPESTDEVIDTPQVVVAVAPDSAALFAVPYDGPSVLVPAARAAPPPAIAATPKPQAKPNKITEFRPGAGDAGTFPIWKYPLLALQRGYQGKGNLHVVVEATGVPKSVEIKDTTGHNMLDRAALEMVRDKWRWPPGEVREFIIPFEFELAKP